MSPSPSLIALLGAAERITTLGFCTSRRGQRCRLGLHKRNNQRAAGRAYSRDGDNHWIADG